MAAITVTNRKVCQHGRFKVETGNFTDDGGGGGYHIETKVGTIIFWKLRGVDTGDILGLDYPNSRTASTTEDDKGSLWLDDTGTPLTADKKYAYFVVGRGA